MNDFGHETAARVDHRPVRPHGMRTDLEVAAMVLAAASSTFTACALALTTLLASYVIRTLRTGRPGGLRENPPAGRAPTDRRRAAWRPPTR